MSEKNNVSTDILKSCILGLEKWENAELTLDEYLDSARYRKSVSSILFEYFRNKAVIDERIRISAKKVKPAVRRIIAIALTQCFFSQGIKPETFFPKIFPE